MKDQIRQNLRNQRNQLSRADILSLSSEIANQVKSTEAFKKAQRVGFYHAVRGEADPALLQSANKHFFLPVLSKNPDQGLVFIESNAETEFKENKFGIPEPVYNEDKTITGDSLDLVIVPLLGFDKQGHRLGMGGGYYDRCFAFKKQMHSKPILMGYAYDFQEIGSLTPEAWDVDLDMIVTESGLITPYQSS